MVVPKFIQRKLICLVKSGNWSLCWTVLVSRTAEEKEATETSCTPIPKL